MSVHNKQNNQCLQRVGDDEPIFVLRAQDASAAQVIGFWLHLNRDTLSKEKIKDAEQLRMEMHAWPNKKNPD